MNKKKSVYYSAAKLISSGEEHISCWAINAVLDKDISEHSVERNRYHALYGIKHFANFDRMLFGQNKIESIEQKQFMIEFRILALLFADQFFSDEENLKYINSELNLDF